MTRTIQFRTWTAACKDCGAKLGSERFSYPQSWLEAVEARGQSRSDRCPACRRKHSFDARLTAIPYIDLDVIGTVFRPDTPTGALGGLGPLPQAHSSRIDIVDLDKNPVALSDENVEALLSELELKQVAVVVAGTGAGKSTYLPFRLLYPPKHPTLAARGPIVVTQPRIFAATDCAARAAKCYRHTHAGPGSEIGFRAEGQSIFDDAARLLYVTDGVLINWIREGKLRSVAAVIVDEAHERSRNIDIILGLLRDAIPTHPDLRVIVASATIDERFFIDYFGGDNRVAFLPCEGKSWGYGVPLWPNCEIDPSHWSRLGPNSEDFRA